MRFSVYIAVSVDGFIARKDGNIDWLHTSGNPDAKIEESQDFGYQKFVDTMDCMVMGRKTFDVVSGFNPWPYQGKRVIVLSRTMIKPPSGFEDKIELYSGSLKDLASKLSAEGMNNVYVDGGNCIQSFLQEKLLTDMILTRIPILIGEGISLFGSVPKDISLRQASCQSFANDFVQSSYVVCYD